MADERRARSNEEGRDVKGESSIIEQWEGAAEFSPPSLPPIQHKWGAEGRRGGANPTSNPGRAEKLCRERGIVLLYVDAKA